MRKRLEEITPAYHETDCPERACDKSGERYRGLWLYGSLECALADAG
jgi:hypothetical protein